MTFDTSGLTPRTLFARETLWQSWLEVEAVLDAHPEIRESAACEAPVKADVTVIAAFYVADRDIPEFELAAWAAERLARYKQPRAYVHLDALPTGANGKLLRRALPALFKG